MRKMEFKFIIASLALLNSALFAADRCCTPTCCPELIEDCCECDVCPPTDEITPKAGPCVKCGYGIYLTADFTYWTAREDNLEFATVFPNGKIYAVDSNWNPGFKVGLGYDLCFDGWDVYAEYTWYNSTVSKKFSLSDPSQEIIDIYWRIASIANAFSTPGAFASENWHLGFNVVDLKLARNFYISRRIMCKPYLGLKGTWQTQKLKVIFEGLNVSGGSVEATSTMFNRMKNWGIGILAGLETAWHVSREVSLIGNVAFTGLWEQFKLHRTDHVFVPSIGTNEDFFRLSETFHVVKPVVEWMLGARWEDWFFCDEYHLALEAGWEMQIWFAQNKFLRLFGTGISNNGDLTLQGLTLKARFDF